ncbi:hypothetical protein F511_30942 [Dorcoceras hygrometricum]|uniref:Uncharacterized protein n=1 Tax=Dorcoceras hygrometricum TaxID=472368 RepID=A0A2Z7B114_9LAMI|nr:hypothetical protein F511_30942 [Dorcoceras hygrometricum]
MAEYSPTNCSTAVRSAVVFFFVTTLCATAVSFLRLVFAPSQSNRLVVSFHCAATGYTKLATWLIFCLCATAEIIVASGSLRLELQLATGCISTAAGCPIVGREILATGFPNDWLDQTMSYQFIQTTSFAMHPRLREGQTLSYQLIQTTSFCNRQLQVPTADTSLLSASAELSSSADCDDITADLPAELFFFDTSPVDFTIPVPAGSSFPYRLQLVLIVPADSLCSSWFNLASALLRTTDSTLDVSIANPAAVYNDELNQLLNFIL